MVPSDILFGLEHKKNTEKSTLIIRFPNIGQQL